MARGVVTSVTQLPVVDLFLTAEFAMDMPSGEEGGLPAAAEAKSCLTHVDNTTKDALSPKEGRAWQ